MKVIIEVLGGNVVAVFSTEKCDVTVMDHDNSAVDEKCAAEIERLEPETKRMLEVY
jgi:hypothetical protein